METGAVTGARQNQDAVTAATTKQLDREAFLKLLITELQNQDPMSPMQDKDFIAQLAQFSSLEQMQRLNQAFEGVGKSQAAGGALAMLGKRIDYLDPESEGPLSGTVTGVTFEDGWATLQVGSARVEMSNVIGVYQ